MASQPHLASQPHKASQPDPAMQQPGYSPASGPGMCAHQAGMQQQAGLYPGVAYTSSAAQQLSCPMSPPDSPQGPSQPAIASQQPLIKAFTRQFMGPQMIRSAMAIDPIMACHMAENHIVGGQMAGKHMVGCQMMTGQMARNQMAGDTVSSRQLSAMQAAPLHSAVACADNGMLHAAAQAQAGSQASNSASSLPGSTASQEGTEGSEQSHVMPQGRAGARQADVSAPHAAVSYPSGQVGLHVQQAGYAASACDSSLSGGMQAGMSCYSSSSQPYVMHGEIPPLLTLLAAYASAAMPHQC